MPDTLRIVTFSTGGRPIERVNLNSAPGTVTAYFRERGPGFQFVPAISSVQYSKQARRYGGARAVGETHENGSVGWTAYVRGATLAAAVQNVESLLTYINEQVRGRFVEWAPEGGLSTYFEIAGPGTWQPTYDPVEFVQTNAMRVQLSFPTLPLAQWARPSIIDDFSLDSRLDYTYDASTINDVNTQSGVLIPVVGAAITVERRARHTARGYTFLEGQATSIHTLGNTLSGYKAGVLLRATSATTYIEVYVDDNGTNSRLRIDEVIAGVRTNRATVNLAVRLVISSGAYAIRGRIQGNVVTAEHFFGATPMGTPNDTTSYTLVTSPLSTTPGYSGWSWIPQHIFAFIDVFDFRTFVFRALSFPRVVQPTDAIPGTAPALADVSITTSGGSAAPAFALMSWQSRPTLVADQGGLGSTYPFNILAAAGAGPPAGVLLGIVTTSNWASTVDAGAITGSSQKDATVSGAETWQTTFAIDPSAVSPDSFTANDLTAEVWARMQISSTVVTPTVILSARSGDGANFGTDRYSNEWGNVGRVLTVPTGTIYRLYRLGTITVPADVTVRRTLLLTVTLSSAAGSTGSVALDYIAVHPARQRALSPTGKAQDATYPTFIVSTTQTTKTIRSNLSAITSSPPNPGMTDHGLGGSLIEPQQGLTDWLIKLSNVVPDDPAPTAVADQLQNTATFQVDVIPRSYMLRTP
jgi:hypothetical protein